jgi:hypothetical protein
VTPPHWLPRPGDHLALLGPDGKPSDRSWLVTWTGTVEPGAVEVWLMADAPTITEEKQT